jgi:hypothetical protein
MLIGALLAPPASYLLHCQPWPPSLHEAGLCHLAWTPLAGALAAVVVLLVADLLRPDARGSGLLSGSGLLLSLK